MRLIDADKLMDALRVSKYYPFGLSIEDAPTVDAVPVIRCKDCKHREDLQFSDGTLHLCERFDKTAAHRIDDLERFCSWGEKK